MQSTVKKIETSPALLIPASAAAFTLAYALLRASGLAANPEPSDWVMYPIVGSAVGVIFYIFFRVKETIRASLFLSVVFMAAVFSLGNILFWTIDLANLSRFELICDPIVGGIAGAIGYFYYRKKRKPTHSS